MYEGSGTTNPNTQIGLAVVSADQTSDDMMLFESNKPYAVGTKLNVLKAELPGLLGKVVTAFARDWTLTHP